MGYASLVVVLLGLFGYVLAHRVPLGFDVVRDILDGYRVLNKP